MPLKKGDDGRRWVEIEFLVPGTPEQVWHAIATGPGMSAWFTRTSVDERVGGVIEFDFGEGVVSSGVVTEWEPPVRLGYEERGWSGDAPPVVTEVTVTGRSGDRCVVRLVHTLFTDRDDWDDDLESFETGWPGFFEVLRLYLKAFPGRPSANVVAAATHLGDMAQAWTALAAALGVAGLDVGQRCQSRSGVPQLGGWVERVELKHEFRDVMMRLEAPCPGIAVVGGFVAGGQTRIMVSLYLYGESAADTAAAEAPKWRAWMAQLGDADVAAT